MDARDKVRLRRIGYENIRKHGLRIAALGPDKKGDPKAPYVKRWQYGGDRAAFRAACSAFDGKKFCGIGMILGDDFLDIETDNEAEVAIVRAMNDGDELPVTVTYESPTGRGPHRIYQADPRLKAKYPETGTLEIKVEGIDGALKLRLGFDGVGAQSAIPPTGGKEYLPELSFDDFAPVPLPKAVIDFLLAYEPPNESNHESNGQAEAPPTGGSGVHEPCLQDMLAKALVKGPEADGSKRLFTVCCRAVEFGLNDRQAVDTVRAYAVIRPFPQAWSEADILQRLRDAKKKTGRGESGLQQLTVPTASVSRTGTALGKLAKDTFYSRGGTVCRVVAGKGGSVELQQLDPAKFVSCSEQIVQWTKPPTARSSTPTPTHLSEAAAKLLLAADTFHNELGTIAVISSCPVLVEESGKLITVVGHHEGARVYAAGEELPDITLGEAKKLLLRMLEQFDFVTEADRSRCLANILTPALVAGGLLGNGRPPMALYEANVPQTGKSYLTVVTAAMYRSHVQAIVQKKRGVGSESEAFDRALIAGGQFICFDNYRGELDATWLEGFLTADTYTARPAYTRNTIIDTRRFCLSLTSNKAELTVDLSKRCCCVRIRKKPKFTFRDLLGDVQANQPLHLAAVHAVLKHWHGEGKPQSNETAHDFRPWAGYLDWIVTGFGLPPLMSGHEEIQNDVSSPQAGYLITVAKVVEENYQLVGPLRTGKITELMLPLDHAYFSNEEVRAQENIAMGKRLSMCFRGADQLRREVGGFVVEREQVEDKLHGRRAWRYTFNKATR